jgi:chemotaxis protein histidine kinase CheA
LSPTQAQAATEKELLSLLFVPGFSTRDASTKHAGRGVGLDVVAAEARAAGGRVGLSSQLNQSTRITVALPIPTEYGRLAATN